MKCILARIRSHSYQDAPIHDAPIHAAMRADELLEKCNLDGYAVWKKIVKAGQESLRVELRDDE